jgi:hypothetical protein
MLGAASAVDGTLVAVARNVGDQKNLSLVALAPVHPEAVIHFQVSDLFFVEARFCAY